MIRSPDRPAHKQSAPPLIVVRVGGSVNVMGPACAPSNAASPIVVTGLPFMKSGITTLSWLPEYHVIVMEPSDSVYSKSP
ncbi:MAG: hypothetical protein BWY82_02306 [Verrucomicrobia bacterium ADurb.Bin474]|nr:MAG: hypothetical protein BWY82_02306 [Verrucomicrobia bacterium ADurb.Bin474]